MACMSVLTFLSSVTHQHLDNYFIEWELLQKERKLDVLVLSFVSPIERDTFSALSKSSY